MQIATFIKCTGNIQIVVQLSIIHVKSRNKESNLRPEGHVNKHENLDGLIYEKNKFLFYKSVYTVIIHVALAEWFPQHTFNILDLTYSSSLVSEENLRTGQICQPDTELWIRIGCRPSCKYTSI